MKLRELIEATLEKQKVRFNTIHQQEPTFHEVYSGNQNDDFDEVRGKYKRGIQKADGTIYMISNQEGLVHDDVIKILAKEKVISRDYVNDWYKNPKSLNEFLAIQRLFGKWSVSVSYKARELGMERSDFNKLIRQKYPGIAVSVT